MPLSVIFLVWVVLCGGLFLYLRPKITTIFTLSIPTYFAYLLIALPIVTVEEALTCGTFPGCLMVTLPMFFLHLSAFYPLIRYTNISENTLVVLYGFWGTFHEFIISGKLALFAPEGIPVLLIMIGLNTLIYAVIGILPIAYATRRNRTQDTTVRATAI